MYIYCDTECRPWLLLRCEFQVYIPRTSRVDVHGCKRCVAVSLWPASPNCSLMAIYGLHIKPLYIEPVSYRQAQPPPSTHRPRPTEPNLPRVGLCTRFGPLPCCAPNQNCQSMASTSVAVWSATPGSFPSTACRRNPSKATATTILRECHALFSGFSLNLQLFEMLR